MIELKYNIDAPDWTRFMGDAAIAVNGWSRCPGRMDKDEYGVYYNMIIRDDIKRKVDIKDRWVLRPATLHLGASKVLQDAWQYLPGFEWQIDELFGLVIKPKDRFIQATASPELLNLLVQVARFRGEVLFPS